MTDFETFLRSLPPDPCLPAILAASADNQRRRDVRLAERNMKRAMFGGCECGEVTGEALCLWCDRDDLPEHLRAAGAMLRQRDRSRGKIDVAKVVEALAAAPVVPATRAPNRFERRREQSRRWRR